MKSLTLALPVTFCLFLCASASSRADQPLPVEVRQMFQAKCAECHSPSPANAKLAIKARKKWSDWSDLSDLKSKHVGAETDAGKTNLWQTLTDKDSPMPPEGARAGGLSGEELAVVRRWIEAGAPPVALAAPRKLVSDAQLLRTILNDLLGDDVPEVKRATTRYFTLANLYNNPNESDERLDLYRQGLFKLINSLSWQSRIVLPVKVDPAGTVWRINLRDLGWSEALWEKLVAAYPYGIDYDSGVARSVSTLTSSKAPFLRADWFVFAASQPPLYHEFLGLGGPKEGVLAALEKRLNVDRLGNLQNGNAARAAIQAGVSGVSPHNRLIERHDGAIGGYYWISYDFSSNLGEQDLPARPLGPPDVFQGDLAFKHAGGEVVFALPNHLQGYLLIKSDGSRLDTAPPDIVNDPNSPSPRGGEIVNGISCMACHDQGMKDKVSDEVRGRADADRAHFRKRDLDLIHALYRPKPEMDKLLAEDKAQFLAAVAKAQCATSAPEPVRALFDRFSKANVDATAAAAELGLSGEDFAQRLAENGLQGLLAEFKGSGVPRDKFIDKFDRIVSGLDLGTHRKPAAAAPPAPKAGDTVANSVGMKLAYIPPGEFQMGSPANEEERSDDETQHKVKLTRGFYLGATTVTQAQWKAVMETDPSHFKGDDLPVEQVSWDDAVEFCRKLGEKEGKKYRLPTEAEWEYACRAGTTTPFNTGATISTGQANYAYYGNSTYYGNPTYGDGVKGVYRHKTTPVRTFKPNAWGLYDMHGNVAQWCSDWYGPYQGDETDPTGPQQGDDKSRRVVRGGAWLGNARDSRSALRSPSTPDQRGNYLGFRVALDSQ